MFLLGDEKVPHTDGAAKLQSGVDTAVCQLHQGMSKLLFINTTPKVNSFLFLICLFENLKIIL